MIRTKRSVAFLGLGLIFAVIAVDATVSLPLNPYVQPPLLAPGSGEAASGAMCSAGAE